MEPSLRESEGYPDDWNWRRKEVFLRANGHCECCGKKTGRLSETTSSGIAFIEPLLRGAHVHHIKKISEGGDHSLSNLQLLCESCHSLKHPDREILGMISMGLSQGGANQKNPDFKRMNLRFKRKLGCFRVQLTMGKSYTSTIKNLAENTVYVQSDLKSWKRLESLCVLVGFATCGMTREPSQSSVLRN